MLCLLLAGSGCSSTRQYDGVERPSSELAILIRHEDGYIRKIDGKWRGIGNIKQYNFLPGKHTLMVDWWPIGSFYRSAHDIILSVDLKPGHTYDLIFTADIAKKEWNAFVKDAATGEIVSQKLLHDS